MYDPPYEYELLNELHSRVSPAFVHVANSETAAFFKRYLTQETLSVFDWTIPDNWDRDYFLLNLMLRGYICIIKTMEYGIIPQQCTLSGRNVFYRPTTAMIANPLLQGLPPQELGTDAELIRLTPDYAGLADTIDYYGNLMALCYETASTNIFNSKLAYVFPSKNKAESDTWKAMFDSISRGEPAVFTRKTSTADMTAEGAAWMPFSGKLRENYIAPEIMETLHTIRDAYLTEIGIPAMSTRKKERVNLAEAHRNDCEVVSKSLVWLDCLNRSIDKVTMLFPEISGQLSVELRFSTETDGYAQDYTQGGGEADDLAAVDSRPV